MNLKIKPLHPKWQPPRYGSAGAAAFDFHAVEPGRAVPGAITKVPLGCAVEVPEGCALLITARSGHGLKHGAGVPHGYGLIDPDYRGELFMLFVTETPFEWAEGDRIAQGLIVPVHHARFDVVRELASTVRGTGGFGSTGVK